MAGRKRSGVKQESVQDFGVLGHVAKTDVRYWQENCSRRRSGLEIVLYSAKVFGQKTRLQLRKKRRNWFLQMVRGKEITWGILRISTMR